MRAAIYARVSSKAQRDSHTIENQLRTLPAFVAAQGWTLVGTYVDDGRSAKAGKLDAREGFARLVRDAEAKRFDVLVVVDIDRLTRTDSMEERAAILGPFQRNGIDIVTPSGGRLDLRTFLGEFYATLQALVAAEENRKRAERIKAGKLRAIAEGRKPAGPTPFGYSYDRARGKWSLHPEQAPIVGEIFERVLRGEACAKIALDLSERGLERPRGGDWSPERVWQIATKRTYLGTWTADKDKGLSVPVPRLIDDRLWHAVQDKLQEHGKRGLRRTKHVYLLEGIAVCGDCGERIGIASACSNGPRSNPSPATYVCTHRRRPPRGGKKCMLPHRRIADVDAAVWAELSAVLMRRDLVELAIRRATDTAATDAKTWRKDLEQAETRLARLVKAEESILARFRRGLISEAAMDKALKDSTRERRMAERQVESARRAATKADEAKATARELETLVASLRGRLSSATAVERQALVRAVMGGSPVVVGAVDVRGKVRVARAPVGQALQAG